MKKTFLGNIAVLSTAAVLLTLAVFTLAGCGDAGGGADADLIGSVTIIPNTSVTTGDLLTVYYYGGTENIETFQWKRGDTPVGKNANTFTPTEAGIYTVTVRAAGYKSKTSNAVEVSAPTAGEQILDGTISISPTINVMVNTVLTASYGGTETIETWQWKKDSADVGTNSSTFTPSEAGLYYVIASAEGYKSKTSAAVNVSASAVNTEPKTVRFIGITQGYRTQSSSSIFGAIFPAGIDPEKALADMQTMDSVDDPTDLNTIQLNHMIAGMSFGTYEKTGDNTWKSDASLINLDMSKWTGSGTVDVYTFLSDGAKGYLYRVPNILIESAVTTVSLSDVGMILLKEVTLPHIGGTISFSELPTDPNAEISVRCEGELGDGRIFRADLGVRVPGEINTKLDWNIPISGFTIQKFPTAGTIYDYNHPDYDPDYDWDDVWKHVGSAEELFPSTIQFSVYVILESGDDGNGKFFEEGYPVPIMNEIPSHFNSIDEVSGIDLGTVSLVDPTPGPGDIIINPDGTTTIIIIE